MAMRYYGAEGKGMILPFEEFKSLFLKYGSKEKIETYKEYEEECFIAEEVFEIKNGTHFACISGEIFYDNKEHLYLEEEDIVVIELSKNSLFEKYDNYDEIYEEIKNNLNEVGIMVDKDYVIENFGSFNGSYIG